MRVFVLDPRLVTGSEKLSSTQLRSYRQIVLDIDKDRWRAHSRIDDLHNADLILAPVNDTAYGPHFELLRNWEHFSDCKKKILIYSPDDCQFPRLPGLYPSCTNFWTHLSWAAPAHFRSDHLPRFDIRRDE